MWILGVNEFGEGIPCSASQNSCEEGEIDSHAGRDDGKNSEEGCSA